MAAHVVGFTNIDEEGQEGIELAYNDILQGQLQSEDLLKIRALIEPTTGVLISRKESKKILETKNLICGIIKFNVY